MMKLLDSILGPKIPEGVEKIKSLGGSYWVGYNPKLAQKQVGLYKGSVLIAHVNIQECSGGILMLHTGTDKGEVGGQGSLGALFPETLKILKKNFSTYQMIEMAPAPGAATKGLIGLLSRLRYKIPLTHTNQFSNARKFMAKRYLEISDMARAKRKEKEKLSKGSKVDANAWNKDAMLETAHELNALMELEYASSTGLQIFGYGGTFADNLVGSTTPTFQVPLHFGGALAWHKSSSAGTFGCGPQGMLQIRIPMQSVQDYINALT